jgi:hypothetical protein
MPRNPLANLTNAKFSPADGFGNKLMSGQRFEFKIVPIHAQNRICDGQSDPLIAIQNA